MTPPAPSCGPGPPGSVRPRRSRTSSSTTSRRSNATSSPTWPPARSSPRPRTWSCSAHPGPGKPTSRSGSGIKAAQTGHRVLFATATEWVTRLQAAHSAGRLAEELARLRRYGLLIVDEVGYIPFEQDAANLFFQLVSSRYEHASLILTSNLPFARWGDVFGDQVVAAAMIDRIVHHAEVITLKGSSHRLRNTGIDTLPSATSREHGTLRTAHFSSVESAQFSSVTDNADPSPGCGVRETGGTSPLLRSPHAGAATEGYRRGHNQILTGCGFGGPCAGTRRCPGIRRARRGDRREPTAVDMAWGWPWPVFRHCVPLPMRFSSSDDPGSRPTHIDV